MSNACVKQPPFPHASDRYERDCFHADPIRHRFDNFYNGYNEDCDLLRRVCCNPFKIERKCCQYCCGNN